MDGRSMLLKTDLKMAKSEGKKETIKRQLEDVNPRTTSDLQSIINIQNDDEISDVEKKIIMKKKLKDYIIQTYKSDE